MTILVTISDDRFGRKDGRYSETQDMIDRTVGGMFDRVYSWKWNDITATDFYYTNRTLLDNRDAARNGRAYKPFVILEGLRQIQDGDYLIYNDCSPELWETTAGSYDLSVIKGLCRQAGDILAPFIRWSQHPLGPNDLGEATHKNYTLNRCMDKMQLRFYEQAYMCASGMICIRKTPATVKLIEEWLYWNCIDECCALGWARIHNDHSFWNAESHAVFGEPGYKMGCRHDQSIFGLLLALYNWKFVETEIDSVVNKVHFANFLQYCRPDGRYWFTECLPPVKIGDKVMNKQGTELTAFDIINDDYIVGVSNASMYSTKRQNLKKI